MKFKDLGTGHWFTFMEPSTPKVDRKKQGVAIIKLKAPVNFLPGLHSNPFIKSYNAVTTKGELIFVHDTEDVMRLSI